MSTHTLPEGLPAPAQDRPTARENAAPAGLDSEHLFGFVEGSDIGVPGEVGYGSLLQSYTEASNVDAVSEITALIVAQRAYEMNSKVISTADQMLQYISQNL